MVSDFDLFQIEWSKLALKDLRKIYKFYIKNTSPEITKKIISPIFIQIKSLQHSSQIGQLEGSLIHLKRNHRYLVCGHLKIIYLIESNIIFITHVFDTRQNPKKLK